MKTTDCVLLTEFILLKTEDVLLKSVDNRTCKVKSIVNQTSLFIECCEATGVSECIFWEILQKLGECYKVNNECGVDVLFAYIRLDT